MLSAWSKRAEMDWKDVSKITELLKRKSGTSSAHNMRSADMSQRPRDQSD